MWKGAAITGLAAIACGSAMVLGLGQETVSAQAAQSASAPLVSIGGEDAKGPYAPRDECASSLPGFPAFRFAVMAAIDARDSDALLALSHPGIELDYGGAAGLDEFARRLSADDTLWQELAALKSLGCASGSRNQAVMPWIFAHGVSGSDPVLAMMVNGNDIAIRTRPDETAPAARRSGFDIVELTGTEGPSNGFYEIALDDGATGYVAAGDLRALTGYRMMMKRGAAGWMIESVIAGD